MLKLDREEKDKYGSSSTSGKEKSHEASITSKVEEQVTQKGKTSLNDSGLIQ
jgi:hypothetical protein